MLTVQFTTVPSSYSKMLGICLAEKDDDSDVQFLFAQYFKALDAWIDKNFEGLTTMENWLHFYRFLAKEVCHRFNIAARQEGRTDTIDIFKIVFPSYTDTIKVCRLLFQSIVNLRVGLADGQHRICAIMNLLSGWSISVQTKTIPPKTFEQGDHFGILNYTKKKCDEAFSERLDQLLPAMNTKANVRIVVPETTTELESWCVKYSHIRERSQAKHKPRVLVDV